MAKNTWMDNDKYWTPYEYKIDVLLSDGQIITFNIHDTNIPDLNAFLFWTQIKQVLDLGLFKEFVRVWHSLTIYGEPLKAEFFKRRKRQVLWA